MHLSFEESQEFTLSIPLETNLKEALGKCGKLSGRDVDKWEEANITKIPAHQIKAPLVEECELHYECKVVARIPLTKDMLDKSFSETFYGDDNYHVLYYGEILGTYIKNKGE